MTNKKKFPLWTLLVAAAVVLAAIILFITLLGKTMGTRPKVGLILTGSVTDSGWNGQHYSGVSAACKELGTDLLVKENVEENTGMCAEAIHQLVNDGAKMVILSSYGYPAEAKEVIESYPDIAFYGISSEYTAKNMTSYFGRMYQARYLSGIIAGMTTKTDSIGYVAAMPNSEVNRGINAFTLGVRSVNPDAVVYVRWTDSWDDEAKEKESVDLLTREKNADVLTCHQNRDNVVRAADAAGVYSIGYNQAMEGLSDKHLTSAVWNWDSLYYEIIREFVQGNANSVQRHWFGIGKGVVGLSELSADVDEHTRQAVEAAKTEIISGSNIFSGDIYDNEGKQRCAEGEAIADGKLFSEHDWYVDGVVIYE